MGVKLKWAFLIWGRRNERKNKKPKNKKNLLTLSKQRENKGNTEKCET
jgi:hypothetical protein